MSELSDNTAIARTILSQLGGAKVMIGLKTPTAICRGVTFRIGRNVKGINVVMIQLLHSDMYALEFFKVHGKRVRRCTTISKATNVGVEDLRRTIGEHTGMAVSL